MADEELKEEVAKVVHFGHLPLTNTELLEWRDHIKGNSNLKCHKIAAEIHSLYTARIEQAKTEGYKEGYNAGYMRADNRQLE